MDIEAEKIFATHEENIVLRRQLTEARLLFVELSVQPQLNSHNNARELYEKKNSKSRMRAVDVTGMELTRARLAAEAVFANRMEEAAKKVVR